MVSDRFYIMCISTLLQALLPLCNIPLIEYTLEFLAAGGVKEVIVATKSHADKIQEYLKCVSRNVLPIDCLINEFTD